MPASWKTMTGPLPKRTGIDPLSAPGMSPANPTSRMTTRSGRTVDNFSRTDQSDLLHHGCGVVKFPRFALIEIGQNVIHHRQSDPIIERLP